MWCCRKCRIIFTSELIEQHYFTNHAQSPASTPDDRDRNDRAMVKSKRKNEDSHDDQTTRIHFYSCGNCREGFPSLNTVTQHCLNQDHSFSLIRKGTETVGQYEQKLLRFIEECVSLASKSTVSTDTKRRSGQVSSSTSESSKDEERSGFSPKESSEDKQRPGSLSKKSSEDMIKLSGFSAKEFSEDNSKRSGFGSPRDSADHDLSDHDELSQNNVAENESRDLLLDEDPMEYSEYSADYEDTDRISKLFEDSEIVEDSDRLLKFMESLADYSHIFGSGEDLSSTPLSESTFVKNEKSTADKTFSLTFQKTFSSRKVPKTVRKTSIVKENRKNGQKTAKTEQEAPKRESESQTGEKGFEISGYVPPELNLKIPGIETNTTARLLAQAALAEFDEEERSGLHRRKKRNRPGRPKLNDNLTGEQRRRLRHAHQCPYCPTVTVGEGHRVKHMRIHNGERPFACKTCGKAFNRNDTLMKHELSHSQIRSHHCDTCGKSFTLMETLTVHLRQHTGARPFRCPAGPPACSAAFTCRTNLRYHLSRCKLGQAEKQRQQQLPRLNFPGQKHDEKK